MRSGRRTWMAVAVLIFLGAWGCCGLGAAEPAAVGPGLQALSVNVFCPSAYGGGAQGSGTIIVSPTAAGPATWVLTANHVIDGLRSVDVVIVPGGGERKQVSYRDAQIIQEQVVGGRVVGEVKYDARIITVDVKRDIALLRVRKADFAKAGAVFYLDDAIPAPGTAVFHSGAPGGKELGGTCSLTAGIVSRIGVRIPDFGGSEHGVFDQTDTAALGGSSGGMLALRADGRWIGMITLGLRGGDSFHWFVPVRSVRAWAADLDNEWLLDPSLKRPTEAEIEVIPLEFTGERIVAEEKENHG